MNAPSRAACRSSGEARRRRRAQRPRSAARSPSQALSRERAVARPASERASIAVRMRGPSDGSLLQPAQVAEAVAAGARDDGAVDRALAGAADGAAVCGQPHAVRSGGRAVGQQHPDGACARLHLGAAHGHRVAVVGPGAHAVAGPQAGVLADRGQRAVPGQAVRRAEPARCARPWRAVATRGRSRSRPAPCPGRRSARASARSRPRCAARTRRAGLGARASTRRFQAAASSSGSTGGCSPSSHSARAQSAVLGARRLMLSG